MGVRYAEVEWKVGISCQVPTLRDSVTPRRSQAKPKVLRKEKSQAERGAIAISQKLLLAMPRGDLVYMDVHEDCRANSKTAGFA